MLASTERQRSSAAKGLLRYGHDSLPLVLLLSAFHLYRLAFIASSSTLLRMIRRVSFLDFRRVSLSDCGSECDAQGSGLITSEQAPPGSEPARRIDCADPRFLGDGCRRRARSALPEAHVLPQLHAGTLDVVPAGAPIPAPGHVHLAPRRPP